MSFDAHGTILRYDVLYERKRFVSRINISDENYGNLSPWRRKLFVFLHENATRPTRYFHLPLKKTITIGTEIKL